MSHHYRSPNPDWADPTTPCVFLAGGITDCPDWQTEAATRLTEAGISVYNPRREQWDMTSGPAASVAQIEWEHLRLRSANLTMFWFPRSVRSVQPIALYELGFAIGEGRPIVVGADPAYMRHLDVVTQLALAAPDTTVHHTLPATIAATIAAFR